MGSRDKQFSAVRSMPTPIPTRDRYKYSLEDLELGGFVRYMDRVWKVEEKSRYEEIDDRTLQLTGNIWFELKLFCLETGQHLNIEWEKDDEIEVSVTIDRPEIRFRDFRDDEGGEVDSDDLDQIAKDDDSIFYEGREYEYDDDYKAVFSRSSDSTSDEVYFYDFEASNGTCLTIEEWNGGKKDSDYDIWLSIQAKPDDFTVLVTGS